MTVPDPTRQRVRISSTTLIRVIIALPWLITGAVTVALAVADARNFQATGLALAVPGVLLLVASGRWLVVVAGMGSASIT